MYVLCIMLHDTALYYPILPYTTRCMCICMKGAYRHIHIHMHIYVYAHPPYNMGKCTFCPFIHNCYQATKNDCENLKIQKPKNLKIQKSKAFHIFGILQNKLDFWIFLMFGLLEF